jgi:hypothetical protein
MKGNIQAYGNMARRQILHHFKSVCLPTCAFIGQDDVTQ